MWVAGLKKIIQLSGRYISWLALLLVLTEFSVVFLRYVFNWGALWLQDSVVYMHGFLFLLGAAFTFQNDQHVRVDILYFLDICLLLVCIYTSWMASTTAVWPPRRS